MPRYAFVGELDDFSPVRDFMEQVGVVIIATSTDDGVLHVTTEALLPYEEPTLTLLEG